LEQPANRHGHQSAALSNHCGIRTIPESQLASLRGKHSHIFWISAFSPSSKKQNQDLTHGLGNNFNLTHLEHHHASI
jgi:hypothetical protein